jgi:chromosome segregation ATPase
MLAAYTSPMSQGSIERRLRQVTAELRQAREELRVLDEQLVALSDDADEARVRALVADSPMADKESREAERHVDAMRRSRAATAATITRLERSVDELLERFIPESR